MLRGERATFSRTDRLHRDAHRRATATGVQFAQHRPDVHHFGTDSGRNVIIRSDRLSIEALRAEFDGSNQPAERRAFPLLFATVYSRPPQAVLFLGTILGTG